MSPMPADARIPSRITKLLLNELANFGGGLDKKPTIVAASKIDAANKEKLAQAEALLQAQEAGPVSDFGGFGRRHRQAEVGDGGAGGEVAERTAVSI